MVSEEVFLAEVQQNFLVQTVGMQHLKEGFALVVDQVLNERELRNLEAPQNNAEGLTKDELVADAQHLVD